MLYLVAATRTVTIGREILLAIAGLALLTAYANRDRRIQPEDLPLDEVIAKAASAARRQGLSEFDVTITNDSFAEFKGKWDFLKSLMDEQSLPLSSFTYSYPVGNKVLVKVKCKLNTLSSQELNNNLKMLEAMRDEGRITPEEFDRARKHYLLLAGM